MPCRRGQLTYFNAPVSLAASQSQPLLITGHPPRHHFTQHGAVATTSAQRTWAGEYYLPEGREAWRNFFAGEEAAVHLATTTARLNTTYPTPTTREMSKRAAAFLERNMLHHRLRSSDMHALVGVCRAGQDRHPTSDGVARAVVQPTPPPPFFFSFFAPPPPQRWRSDLAGCVCRRRKLPGTKEEGEGRGGKGGGVNEENEK